jgi:hypothetical protein
MRSEAVVKLGKKLVDELTATSSVDTLARWMAHHIAALIEGAENAKPSDQPTRMDSCRVAILQLWNHISDLRNGRRPFVNVESIARVVETLDLDNHSFRYFSDIQRELDEVEEESQTQEWVQKSRLIDYAAKATIGHCLGQAARAATDQSAEWVELAKSAEVPLDRLVSIVSFISAKGELAESPEFAARRVRNLEEQINRLEQFVEIANTLTADLRSQLKAPRL